MSAGRPWPWWLLPVLLCGGAGGYVVVSSVSWPLPEAGAAAADELHSSSTEEALPALLEEAGGFWKQSYPASAYREDAALGSGPAARRPEQGAAPSRMFSYRREGGGAPGRAGTARFLARHSTWGFVATRAARGKIQGMPYGNCLLLSDGPVNNSTGIPFFYVTPKDNTVIDLLKNPMASLTLPEADGNFCSSYFTSIHEVLSMETEDLILVKTNHLRNHLGFPQQSNSVTVSTPDSASPSHPVSNTEMLHKAAPLHLLVLVPAEMKGIQGLRAEKNVIDPEDPRCARLTLMGQMVTVPPEEVEFAKQAMFSRHPVVRKWPRSYEWFFMKMNIEHIWIQSWYGEVSPIAVEEYLKAVPSKG